MEAGGNPASFFLTHFYPERMLRADLFGLGA
jgi:hypothetical protein